MTALDHRHRSDGVAGAIRSRARCPRRRHVVDPRRRRDASLRERSLRQDDRCYPRGDPPLCRKRGVGVHHVEPVGHDTSCRPDFPALPTATLPLHGRADSTFLCALISVRRVAVPETVSRPRSPPSQLPRTSMGVGQPSPSQPRQSAGVDRQLQPRPGRCRGFRGVLTQRPGVEPHHGRRVPVMSGVHPCFVPRCPRCR